MFVSEAAHQEVEMRPFYSFGMDPAKRILPVRPILQPGDILDPDYDLEPKRPFSQF